MSYDCSHVEVPVCVTQTCESVDVRDAYVYVCVGAKSGFGMRLNRSEGTHLGCQLHGSESARPVLRTTTTAEGDGSTIHPNSDDRWGEQRWLIKRQTIYHLRPFDHRCLFRIVLLLPLLRHCTRHVTMAPTTLLAIAFLRAPLPTPSHRQGTRRLRVGPNAPNACLVERAMCGFFGPPDTP